MFFSRRRLHFRVRGISQGAPLAGESIAVEHLPRHIAISGEDYRGLRPVFSVEEGAEVRAGDALLTDRRRPGLTIVAPAGGKVVSVLRGGRRTLDRLVIAPHGDDARRFAIPATPDRRSLTALMLESGIWQALRSRPFDDTPLPDAVPRAVFVTAIETRPLAPDPMVAISKYSAWFTRGLDALRLLTDGPVWLCHAPDVALPVVAGVTPACFSGPHPAGLAGTHIHHLCPVNAQRSAWHIGYQDVIALGHLLETGHIRQRRLISIAGDGCNAPRLIETIPGADIRDLTEGLHRDEASGMRLISGSRLDGRPAHYLGRWHLQVTMVAQGERHPATAPLSHSLFRPLARLRALLPQGGVALVPNAAHERAAPAGILPVPFLRALSVGDTETALRLGLLDLAEEDMALLTHVDGCRNDYGALLRRMLDEVREAQ